jgi:hypothetical protein
VQPGWYDDPFARGWLRWWDGTRWSAQQAPAGIPRQPTFYGVTPPTPAGDLYSETRWARWALWSFAAGAVVYIAFFVVGDPFLARYFRHIHDSCQDQFASGAVTCTGTGPSQWQTQLAGNLVYLPVLVDVPMMMWLRGTAEIARRMGLPARHSPTWAFGFFVPVANLWFPYQVAADTLPPGAPQRSTVGWWWALRLVQLLAAVPIFVVALFSLRTAIVLGVIAAVFPVLQAWYGRRMVLEILEAHRRLVAGR